jgi:hypothetical protein
VIEWRVRDNVLQPGSLLRSGGEGKTQADTAQNPSISTPLRPDPRRNGALKIKAREPQFRNPRLLGLFFNWYKEYRTKRGERMLDSPMTRKNNAKDT